jgi:hypothetical protein
MAHYPVTEMDSATDRQNELIPPSKEYDTGRLADLLLNTEKYAKHPDACSPEWIKAHFHQVFGLPTRYRVAHRQILVKQKCLTTEEFIALGIGINPHEAPLTCSDLSDILGLTIKKDDRNKIIAFLAQLSAYTQDSQMNVSFNAPSSTGKSFIPTEVARLFPKEDVIEVGYCSPTAFFHDVGTFLKERQGYVVDLSRKILIFLDQPHTMLLQHLRPLLSHDKQEIGIKITDKSQKAGLRTKNIYIKGFPSVFFCTAGLKVDEQEATRFILLSPEATQEKLRDAINERIRRETDKESYKAWLEADPRRRLLKQRIQAIKQEHVVDVNIGSPCRLKEAFFSKNRFLKPRHQRDITRIIALVKSFALLNLWHREREGNSIVANESDITDALCIWEAIAQSQELNLPPYAYDLYRDVIVEAYREKNGDFSDAGIGLTRSDVIKKHLRTYGRPLSDWQFRQELIPMFESAGLITQEPDPADKRSKLIYPTTALTISSVQDNSELGGGVNHESNGNGASKDGHEYGRVH